MPELDELFTAFLLRAKRATYAAGDDFSPQSGQLAPPSRLASHDLAYQEGEWAYLDTYLGGFAFIGEEAVWCAGQPLWGMNYYGCMTIEHIPTGFSDFLKLSLRNGAPEMPYRGPRAFKQGNYAYTCVFQGSLERFRGEETIKLDGQKIYSLDFHGGRIR